MKYQLRILIIVLGVMGSLQPLIAQSGGEAMPYHRIGSQARILGIGNAYSAGSYLGIYPQYNPALAAQSTFNQIDLSGAILSFDRNLATASVSFPLPPNAGLHFTTLYSGVSGFDGRSPSGYSTGEFSTHDLQATATFGLQLNPRVAIGLSARFLTARYNPEIPAPISFGADVGFRYQYNPSLGFGFTIQDMLSEFTWDTQNLYNTAGSIQQIEKLPTRIKLGIEYVKNELNLALFLEMEHRISSAQRYETTTVIDRGRPINRVLAQSETFTTNFIRSGIQWEAHDRISLRGGWQSGDTSFIGISQRWSTGFTIKLPFDLYSPEVDYAVMREPNGVSWMHLFSVRLHVNK
jgi:hypothetical protein